MLNALTVDVEDYFHVSAFDSVVRFEDWDRFESRVERNTDHILSIFTEYRTKATFFVLGWVCERYPQIVRSIHALGHEVASHGYAHQRIHRQTPKQFYEETKRAKHILEEVTGEPILGYRAASYSITKKTLWALDILAELGFRYDSSIFPVTHDLYGIPGYNRFPHILNQEGGQSLIELPLSTIRIAGINLPVAGGGYLRLSPYTMTHWAIRHLNNEERQPALVYFHPWELDWDQPRMSASWLSQFRHYTNLKRMEKKIRSLLTTFSFAPIKVVHADLLNGHSPANSKESYVTVKRPC